MTPATALADPTLLAWTGIGSILAFWAWHAAAGAYRARRAERTVRTTA